MQPRATAAGGIAKRPQRQPAWIGGLWILFSSAALAQPPNDDFADRIVLEGLPVQTSGTNRDATSESREPGDMAGFGGSTVWWSWAAPVSARVAVSLRDSDFDTVLAVYSGAALGDLELVARNDDEDVEAGLFTSRAEFSAVPGRLYQIRVGGFGEGQDFAEGAVALAIVEVPARPAPAWTVTGLDGRVLRSSDFSDQVVLLDFWATWCGPCIQEIPSFIALQDKYRDRGFTILGVSVDAIASNRIESFAIEHDINYPLARSNDDIEQAFGGIRAIPTTFLIDRQNRILFKEIGYREGDFWEREIAAVLANDSSPEPPPDPSIVRAGKQVVVSWPVQGGPVRLESTTSIDEEWAAVLEPIDIRDGRASVSLAPEGVARFLRLRAVAE